MKIVLTRPGYNSHIVSPPLGMGYLSSYLKSKGHEVKIIDGLNYDLSNDEIVRRCLEFDAKLVGIYILSAYFLDAQDLIKKLKSKNLKVMIGGSHPSFMPEFTLEKTKGDFIVIGEAEHTVGELVNAFESGKPVEDVAGVYTKNTKKILQRPLIEDLDSLPFPDWEQIDPRKYKKAPHGGLIKHFPYAPMITTRGCPYKCTFCASPKFSQGRLRRRSPKNVVDEIEYLISNFGIKEIHFEDDNLTLHRPHIVEICRLLMEKKLKISWACPNGVRADHLDMELLKMMKKAGCYYLAFGIESGNQEILDNVKKNTSLEKLEEGVKMASKAGIMTQGFFIFGLPGETEETIKKTIKFAKKLPLSRAQFLLLDVMPGTEIWDTLNFEEQVDWTKNSYHEVTWVPPTIDKEYLQNSAPRAFREFYFRPKQMLSLIRYFKVSQIPFVIKRIKDCYIVPSKKASN